MNLFILCIATILANNWALANPGQGCGQNCGSQCGGAQNCGAQNFGGQNCNGFDEYDLTLLNDDQRTELEFNRFDITSDYFLPKPPKNYLRIKFPTTPLPNLGNRVSPARTTYYPSLRMDTANPKLNYTFMGIDMDVPSPTSPVQIAFLIGLTINIPGSALAKGTLTTDGDDVAPWIGPGPAPGSGPHRILGLIFEQTCEIDPCDRIIAEVSAIRIRYDLPCFRRNFSLNLVGGNFWTSCVPDDYCNVCDRNKPYRLNMDQSLYSLLNNDNMCLSQ